MNAAADPSNSAKEFGDWQSKRQREQWSGSQPIHHPWNGRTGIGPRKKSNTCLTRKASTTARLIVALETHLEQHPRDAASKLRLANAREEGR